jgi:3-oxoacyl-[acyl-carrier-protein] synthase II
MTAPAAQRPVITGWSAVSPFGSGRAAHSAGVRSGHSTAASIDGEDWKVPDERACLVPDYDPAALVGGRVAKYLDRATVLALAAVGHLVGAQDEPGDRVGLVLATTAGSVQSTMAVTRDSLVGDKPFHVNPKSLPSAIMNGAAAQCAIRYGLTGPNTTLAGGSGAVLSALAYASRLLAAGRADSVLAGAVEEYSVARSWLSHHDRHSAGPLGEGSVVFRIERGARAPLAEIMAVDSRVCVDGDTHEALRACLTAMLAKATVRAGEIWAVLPAVGRPVEREVAAEMFGDDALARCPHTGQIGDTGAASAGFAIASALSVPGPPGRLVVIAAADPGGSTTSVLLRLMAWSDDVDR